LWEQFEAELMRGLITMNPMTRRMCTVSLTTLGMLAAFAGAQVTGTKPAADPAKKQAQPVKELTGHEGHNHGPEGHNTGTLRPLNVNPNGQAAPTGPTANSVLLFKETTVSTGTILDTDPVDVNFEFMNTGGEDLEITLIKPSCGCTVPDMSQKVYAPGEKGVMKVTFDPSGKNGPISRNITIYTNSSAKPVHTIILHSYVNPVVITEPRILAFDLTQKGQGATKDINVYGRFEDFKISRATTQDIDTFGIEIIDGGKVEKNGEDMWLQIIRVSILESAKPDSHRTEITVRTNEPHKELFSLSVVGRVIGDLELTPVRMTMGRLVVGDEFEREVTLRSKSGDAFEVKSVNSVNVVLDAQYTATPVDPEKRNEWTITVKGTVIHPAQRFNAQLNVLTDVADEETLTVQMYGQLQPKAP
tara:strand:+ start:48758 stop:50008 length:1251 start_codon:yes stop_codon:yes gene_type:complete